MRIREVYFRDFRSFRGVRRISFVDPLTDAVRPVTVLAGSNGSGKTTIFDTIEALLAFVLNQGANPKGLIAEALETGLIALTVELSPQELGQSNKQPSGGETANKLVIAAGRHGLLPTWAEKWPDLFCRLRKPGAHDYSFVQNSRLAENLRQAVLQMERKRVNVYGGLLYFPHDRRLSVTRGGIIEPPKEEHPWSFRFTPADRWPDSLEQLWVWRNYLDLEQHASGRPNLRPFVETVEDILGEGRRITIKEGRAQVPPSWAAQKNGESVRLDQLPSGEQQMLLLFGELARRRRPGAVIAIDEIENSLHPTLQRLAMWNLHRIARDWDAQVIVATHSWEVIRSVRGGAFLNLDYPEDHFDQPIPDQEYER